MQLEATDAGAELAELHRAGGAQGEQRRFCFYLGLKLRIKIGESIKTKPGSNSYTVPFVSSKLESI